jgi:disulfide oxidoreductase YuzD
LNVSSMAKGSSSKQAQVEQVGWGAGETAGFGCLIAPSATETQYERNSTVERKYPKIKDG